MNPLKPYKEHIVGELAEVARWTVLNVKTGISWPYEVQKVRWRDRDLFILPASEDKGAGVAVKLEKHEVHDEVQKLLLTFLSALCWVERGGAEVTGFGGGAYPVPWERERRYGSITKQLDLTYLPEPGDDKARLALALFREGSSVNHPAFAFLSFFRVLELRPKHRWSNNMIKWINRQIPHLSDHKAQQIAAGLSAKHADLGAYLYESGRCAVAHANSGVIVDPDDYTDVRRLEAELPLMRELAIRFIELTQGVKTGHTIYNEHLYELAGFRKIISEEVIERLKNPDDQMEGVVINVPTITIGLIDKTPYAPLDYMIPFEFQRGPSGQLVVSYTSPDNLISFRFWLDFANERLHFNIQNDLAATDSGSLQSAENMAELARFVWDYWRNGKLVITETDTGEQMSRKDAFIPVNVILRGTENVEQQAALKQADRRRAQVERLVAIVRNDPDLMTVLTTVRGLGLDDWLVFSGAVYQAAWNDVTGRAPGYGVKDFDVGYFDEDVSWDAEDVVIKRVAEAFQEPLRGRVEVRNQRRVSEWFETKFGEPYPPIDDTAEALKRFIAPAFAVGVRLAADDTITVVAPFGLDDVFDMRIRPNPLRPVAKDWDRVTARALERWPELTIVAPN
ncbi:hypothetical protein BSP_00425 [Brevundimonas sp. Bb-A]|nr:hypothetical protein BSP_00425 [Brevundimonas sp. Bb-A]